MNEPTPQFRLTPMDRQDPVWQKLVVHFEKRLAQLRQQNDQDLNIEKTAHLRGRIQEVISTLALNRDSPIIEIGFPAALGDGK